MAFTHVEGITRRIPAAYSEQDYGGLSNKVEIEPLLGPPAVAYIRPPSWTFFLLAQLDIKAEDAYFYLQEERNRHCTFGIGNRGTGARLPLIDYLLSEVPYWATPEYQGVLHK